MPDGSLGPLEQLDRAEQIARLRAAVGRLSPAYRTVLQLRDWEDMSYEEIAQVLGVPVGHRAVAPAQRPRGTCARIDGGIRVNAMDCDSASKRLSAMLDGALPDGEAAVVQHHLQGCGACARRFRLLEDTRRLFRALPPEPVSPGFDAAVRSRSKPHRRRSWLLGTLGLAATLTIVLLRGALFAPEPSEATRTASGASWNELPGASDGLLQDPTAGLDCSLNTGICRLEVPCGQSECGLATGSATDGASQ